MAMDPNNNALVQQMLGAPGAPPAGAAPQAGGNPYPPQPVTSAAPIAGAMPGPGATAPSAGMPAQAMPRAPMGGGAQLLPGVGGIISQNIKTLMQGGMSEAQATQMALAHAKQQR